MKEYLQQPGESARAFAAFRIYLEAGPDRSIRKLGRKLGKNRTTLGNWSSKWHWAERVKAWEADEAERIRQAEIARSNADAAIWAERRAKVKHDEFKLGQDLLARARKMLDHPLMESKKVKKGGKVTVIIRPANWTTADLARIATTGAALVRNSTGLNEGTGGPIKAEDDIAPIAQGKVVIMLPDNGRK